MGTGSKWNHIAALVGDGATLTIDTSNYHFKVASLYDETRNVLMFKCDGMDFDAIMDHLDELARRYREEGIVTDEVNGSEYSVW